MITHRFLILAANPAASTTGALAVLGTLLVLACGGRPAPVGPAAASTPPTSSTAGQAAPDSAPAAAFVYRPEAAGPGLLYHYTRSNRDGTRAARLETFIASTTRMEVLKLEPWSDVAALVTAEMDWSIFSPVALESWHIPADGSQELMATLAFQPAERLMTVKLGGHEQSLTVEKLPYHIYNFDFGSLNFAFRHLANPDSPFQITIVDPNWNASASDPRVMLDKGLVTVELTDEQAAHRGRPARRYRVYGPGLDGQEGYILVHRDAGHIELMEFPLPTSPDYQDVRLELESIEPMDRATWSEWKMKQARAHAGGARSP